ncbi:MAG: Glutamine--fructose-6-phosphate aminotransferase (isomerizing) [Tenericutes bacterium ADurb.Bin024]|nr:MAG: Glutamine--fructose-6-phosphate aminotransferase (isomerizing) [Tenericutes bacterium ADurb.Bin024]
MSGFIGRIGNSFVKEKILSGLNLLQFKDDDSTGVLFCNKAGHHLYRVVGKVPDLLTLIPEEIDGYMGIGHTRWSTYMHQVLENVYPLSSENGYVTLVVNGLIDNIQMIKRRLIKRGYNFRSNSAVEVVANLIEDGAVENEDPLRALHRAMQQLEGDYALLAVFNGNCKKIFFGKNGVPLIIGKDSDGMVICTDYTPIADQANEYYYPNDGELGYLTADNVVLFNHKLKEKRPSFTEVSVSEKTLELGEYPHYMLKEIEEAPGVIRRLINHYFDGTKYRFDDRLIKRIIDAGTIVFIAAGTSYNAALVGQRYLRNFNKKVDVFIASEWIFYPYQSGEDTLYILISQSGETADILKCLRTIRAYGADVLAITNVEVSTLYQSADYRLLLHAGTEVSVASTKAYIAQITLLSLIYARLVNKITTIAALERVIEAIHDIISRRDSIKAIADQIYQSSDVFFLGRGFDYDVAVEAQLKLKETSYIHAEAYPGGEMLHGPIALVEENTPVIFFISDSLTVSATREVIREMRDRKAHTIVCSLAPFNHEGDSFVISNPIKGYHSPITFAVFAQYLAYYSALKLGRDVDKPRNLTKAVKDRSV